MCVSEHDDGDSGEELLTSEQEFQEKSEDPARTPTNTSPPIKSHKFRLKQDSQGQKLICAGVRHLLSHLLHFMHFEDTI